MSVPQEFKDQWPVGTQLKVKASRDHLFPAYIYDEVMRAGGTLTIRDYRDTTFSGSPDYRVYFEKVKGTRIDEYSLKPEWFDVVKPKTVTEQAQEEFPAGTQVRLTDPKNVPVGGQHGRDNYELNLRDNGKRLNRDVVYVIREIKAGWAGPDDPRVKLTGTEHSSYAYPVSWFEKITAVNPIGIEDTIRRAVRDSLEAGSVLNVEDVLIDTILLRLNKEHNLV